MHVSTTPLSPSLTSFPALNLRQTTDTFYVHVKASIPIMSSAILSDPSPSRGGKMTTALSKAPLHDDELEAVLRFSAPDTEGKTEDYGANVSGDVHGWM